MSSEVVGTLVIVMVLPPIFRRVGVGITVGVFVDVAVLVTMRPKKNDAHIFLEDSRRMLGIVGSLIMLSTLLATLGAMFTAAGVGGVVSHIVGAVIPRVALSWALGRCSYSRWEQILRSWGSLALICGYRGTLMTPMAASFNIVPVAILEMRDEYGVIKRQIVPALIMLMLQICLMVMLVAVP